MFSVYLMLSTFCAVVFHTQVYFQLLHEASFYTATCLGYLL
jgi:hypothetical protein